jgi:transposase
MARRQYPPEFRQQLIALVRGGRTPEALAKEFEPSAQTIRNWATQAARDGGTRTDGLTTDERTEMTRLRRENRQLKLEREILSKNRGLVRTGDRHDSQRVYGFVKEHQAFCPVAMMCRDFRVSFAANATAKTSKSVSPSRVIRLSPAEDSAEARKYLEERKNARPQSAEEKARTAGAQAHAESTFAEIISLADSSQGSGKKGSEPGAGDSPLLTLLDSFERVGTRRKRC